MGTYQYKNSKVFSKSTKNIGNTKKKQKNKFPGTLDSVCLCLSACLFVCLSVFIKSTKKHWKYQSFHQNDQKNIGNTKVFRKMTKKHWKYQSFYQNDQKNIGNT